MKVSVIVPTYRRDWELERAIVSLGRQTYRDFEIIVVDDNCEEEWNRKTAEIVAQCTAQFPLHTIQYIRNAHKAGSAMARNAGAAAAAGEYITFLDDDDEYLPEKIEQQLQFAEDQKLDYCITDLDLFYPSGRLSEHRTREYIRNTKPEALMQYHLMHHMTGTDTFLFKKAYFEKIGGFPPIDSGDEFYLMVRAIEEGGKFGYLPRCDVRAYVHVGEGGLSSGEGKIAGQKRLFEYKKQFFCKLERKNVRYIKMRHYAVLSFAGLRMHNLWIFAKYGFLGFVTAPVQCIRMLMGSRRKRNEG